MISLGPEFAADLSALNAAQPQEGGAAPFDQAGADLFNTMLGQMMGEVERSFGDGDAPQDAGEMPEAEGDSSVEIDPVALINPIVVAAAAPVAQAVPTTVWSIPTAEVTVAVADHAMAPAVPAHPETPLPAADSMLAAIEVPEGVDTPAASELPAPDEHTKTADPRPRQLTEVDAKAPLMTAAAVQPEAEAAPQKDSPARTEFATQIAEAVRTDERTDRPAKQDSKAERADKADKAGKAAAEPKIDASGIRPVPFVAVERAYAGQEQGGARSFDSPKEQAPFMAAPQGGQSLSAPAFVVPADGRSLLNAPMAMTRDAVDIPAAMARDIDTNVPPQIVQSIRLHAINGGGEAVIRLNPGYLGEVVVAVKVEQGNVIAALQAETPAVRQWVERNESVLRQALAEQGLQLDKLTVAEKASETEREDAHDHAREDAREEHSQQQPRRRRQPSDEATFEVTV